VLVKFPLQGKAQLRPPYFEIPLPERLDALTVAVIDLLVEICGNAALRSGSDLSRARLIRN
jgi:hypothetical protein